MANNVLTSRCAHCDQTAGSRPVTDRIIRCEACGFLLPKARSTATDPSSPRLHKMPDVARDGLLRGKYRLIERLGEGAHGVSYLAEHVYLGHPCVVKILPHRIGEATDAAVRRLRNEARAGFQVHDQNVVRVLDCDVYRGVWYFVMEYINGVDLATLLASRQRMSWQQAVRVGSDVARGLAAIHQVGLVHRDIKPGNLILGADGQVRVADLGVASLAHDGQDASPAAGAAMAGTLAYTAPEMFQPGAVPGPRADLYSLGVTIFHLVAGRLPHAGNKVFQRLIDVQCRPVTWPTEAGEDVPEWLVGVILRLLAIDPAERVESPEALIEQFRPAIEQPPLPRAAVRRDSLQPRGIGVLPLENECRTPDDDWLGYAVATYLSRALSGLADVYVANQDSLVAMLDRVELADGMSERDRVLEAGRRVGAGTLVTGRFSRQGARVRIRAEAVRGGDRAALARAEVEGELAELSALERSLFERLARDLDLGKTGREQAPPPALDAREKLVLGKQAYLHGEYEEAIRLADEAIRVEPEFAEAIGLAGICLARLGRNDAAEARHRRQEELALRWGDVRRRIEALANLGVMYYFRGDYEAAEAHYTPAARLAEERDLDAESAQIWNNLGFVLFRRNRLREAEQAFLRSIRTHRAYGGLASLVGPYNGMGNVLAQEKRYPEARDYYRRALALAAETGDRTSVGTTHMHLGHCAAQEGRFADAKHEFTMALNALEETRFWNGLARVYEYSADMHLQLGNYDEAVRCADKRIELARQHSNIRMESAAWLQKAESLRRAGRQEEATECVARGRRAEAAGSSSSRRSTDV